MTTWTTLATPARRATLMRRAQLLAAASVAYNTVEAVIAITAGNLAGSSALVGFGLDSIVEVSSGLVILWQFRHPMPESRERTSQRLIAISFFALAAYLTVEAGHALLTGAQPDSSLIGIGLAIASLAVMPFLSVWQRRTGRELGSGAVEGDGTQTLLCTYLSAVLLVGLFLNASLGWTWADPVAALIIAAVAAREGWENWQGDDCCTPAALSVAREGSAAATGCTEDACCDAAPSEDSQQATGKSVRASLTLAQREDRP
ncbi:cation diffusion facilitator family transporter [Knoellia aerolata]|uniref:Membrane protein n=1 Tax=Knoellia aerolata DSM 18566 TaxID=1385519 RepID=A0A0A0JWI0_9MICO|nr:cation transporter [Knoellia aerolata]KGN41004.1 membrane protein [Knoellia aerolata DSM 18566]